MAKSLLKFLAIPALLAGVAQSLPAELQARETENCPFTNLPADHTIFQVGDNYVLTWNPDGLPEGTMDLVVQSALVTPILTGYGYNWQGELVPIYDYAASSERLGSPDIQDKTFTWPVKVIGNGSATGPEWDYLITGTYVLQYNEGAGATTGLCISSHFQVGS